MSSEKNKSNLSKEAQKMKDLLWQNYSDLQYRRLEYVTTRGMIEQEEAHEDLLFDFKDDDVTCSCLPVFASESKKQGGTAAGGPSRSGGAAAVVPATLPPLDNMGLHKYRDAKLQSEREKNDAFNNAFHYRDQHRHKTLGGYDGGVEIGVHGEWNDRDFTAILDQLEHARKMAESDKCDRDECYVTIGDRVFLVEPVGCKIGVYYRYIFTGQGVRFYLHHSPSERFQPVRLRYNHDALVGRDLFEVHETTREWLEEIGFHVTKETLSRVDMQVTLQRATADFMNLIARGHAVRKTRKCDIHMNGPQVQTYTSGKTTQICIYDKREELCDGGDEIKMRLVVKHLLGLDMPEESCMINAPLFLFEHLTRVEFRLRRSRLREMGIDSVADLKEKELSLIAFMTEEWFRILDEPKVRGHENTQEVHEIWQEVQQLFRRYFPGDDAKRSEIKRGRDNGIRCTGDALRQQACGCLASYLAITQGSKISEKDTAAILKELLESNVAELTQQARERAKELEVTRGFTPIPQVPNGATGATNASDAMETTEATRACDAMDRSAQAAVLKFWGLPDRACG